LIKFYQRNLNSSFFIKKIISALFFFYFFFFYFEFLLNLELITCRINRVPLRNLVVTYA
jgi:hypothetical protein